MLLGVGADDEIGQDTARPTVSTRLSTVRVCTIRLRRTQLHVTRQAPLDSDLADGKDLIKRLDAHARGCGQLRIHGRTDREPDRLDESIEEWGQDIDAAYVATDDGQQDVRINGGGHDRPRDHIAVPRHAGYRSSSP